MTDQANDQYFEGFAWALPRSFAEPLSNCCFEEGDILYDSRLAYHGTWSEALQHISYSILITYPPRGMSTTNNDIDSNENPNEDDAELNENTDEGRVDSTNTTIPPELRINNDKVFMSNWETPVVFTFTNYTTNISSGVETTQGRLYTLLWTGNLKYIDNEVESPPVPMLVKSILKELDGTEGYFKDSFNHGIACSTIFLMPYDQTLELYRNKFHCVKSALSKDFIYKARFVSPNEVGLHGFVPTVMIACFSVDGPTSNVMPALKSVLYRPSKDKKTIKDTFSIKRHGRLIAL